MNGDRTNGTTDDRDRAKASERPRSATDDRAQSGIIGYVLIVALVILGVIIVVAGGATVIDDLQQERSDSRAQVAMEGVDNRLSTLTQAGNDTRSEFTLAGTDGGDARLVRDGFVNVTVNENGACATNVSLSSIRYENDAGRTIAYEAGGVWTATGNGSAMQTAPDLQYRNGSLDVTVVNMTGSVTDDENAAYYNASTSKRESERRSRQLFTGECARPNNVTVTVRSDYYRAWGDYLAEELGTSVETFDGNRTARAVLDQSKLPRHADDSRNHVINVSDASYMDDVELVGNTVRVGKNVSNKYNVYVEPLVDERLDMGQIRVIDDATNVTGRPLDVVFVVDESGSMSYDAGSDTKRITATQDAIQNFVAELNGSRDRVGLVGYSSDHGSYDNCAGDGPPRPSWAPDRAGTWIYSTNGDYFTSSFGDFNTTAEETRSRCGTWGSAGLAQVNSLLHLKSDQTREQVVVFLSDGAFSGHDMDGSIEPDDAAELRAQTTAQQGAVLYTVGFGDDDEFDPDVLENMAEVTDGEYYNASDQDQLEEVFTNIATRISSTRQIARMPTSTNLSRESGQAYAPQITGDTGGIAVEVSDGKEYLNVNDPTAPTRFSHAFAVGDNETVSVNATTYDCDEWRGTGMTRSHEGDTYQVTRCTDLSTAAAEIDGDNADVYRDGDNFSSVIADDDPEWWQENVTDGIDSRTDVSLNSSDHLEMQSNQALAVMDYPDLGDADNKLVLLYEIGRPEGTTTADDIVNVRVRNVTVSD